MQRDFIIPEQNLADLHKRLEKLGKRAGKHGVPMPTVQLGVTVNEKQRDKNGVEYLAKFQKITVNWDDAKVNGWKIAATLQHIPEGNIVRNISGSELPKNYRNADPTCDHCNINRRRNDTYVLRNEQDNTYRQVGGSCLESFLGTTPEKLLRQAELISNTLDAAEASETLPSLGSAPSLWPLEVYLAYVIDDIKTGGWVSKADARARSCKATATAAYERMTETRPEHRTEPSQEAKEEAPKAIEWCENVNGAVNEYMHNIKTIALSSAVEYRTLGFAASIVPAYRRDGVKQNPQAGGRTSGHVGEVGKRIEAQVTITSATCRETQYGESWFYRMKDLNGNLFIWKTGVVLEEGKTINVTGRVKEHSEWRGEKQTVLTHCRVGA